MVKGESKKLLIFSYIHFCIVQPVFYEYGYQASYTELFKFYVSEMKAQRKMRG